MASVANQFSATQAAREIAAGRLTSETLVRACLARIAEREPTVQAWQPLSDDEATGEALLSSLKKPGDPENAADEKPSGGRPGLN